jgi:hypothetical protein
VHLFEKNDPRTILESLNYDIIKVVQGGDLASTWVAKPDVHAEKENSRKSVSLNINANDENFAGEDIIAA